MRYSMHTGQKIDKFTDEFIFSFFLSNSKDNMSLNQEKWTSRWLLLLIFGGQKIRICANITMKRHHVRESRKWKEILFSLTPNMRMTRNSKKKNKNNIIYQRDSLSLKKMKERGKFGNLPHPKLWGHPKLAAKRHDVKKPGGEPLFTHNNLKMNHQPETEYILSHSLLLEQLKN